MSDRNNLPNRYSHRLVGEEALNSQADLFANNDFSNVFTSNASNDANTNASSNTTTQASTTVPQVMSPNTIAQNSNLSSDDTEFVQDVSSEDEDLSFCSNGLVNDFLDANAPIATRLHSNEAAQTSVCSTALHSTRLTSHSDRIQTLENTIAGLASQLSNITNGNAIQAAVLSAVQQALNNANNQPSASSNQQTSNQTVHQPHTNQNSSSNHSPQSNQQSSSSTHSSNSSATPLANPTSNPSTNTPAVAPLVATNMTHPVHTNTNINTGNQPVNQPPFNPSTTNQTTSSHTGTTTVPNHAGTIPSYFGRTATSRVTIPQQPSCQHQPPTPDTNVLFPVSVHIIYLFTTYLLFCIFSTLSSIFICHRVSTVLAWVL